MGEGNRVEECSREEGREMVDEMKIEDFRLEGGLVVISVPDAASFDKAVATVRSMAQYCAVRSLNAVFAVKMLDGSRFEHVKPQP